MTSSDGTEVTAKKLGDDSWEVHTKSGFGGIIRGTIATNSDVATVVNTKPTASSQDYTSTKGTAVDLRNEAKAAGVESVEVLVDEGAPVGILTKLSDVDLIICGATGYNSIENMMIGSVAERIVRLAKCDVLVVRN